MAQYRYLGLVVGNRGTSYRSASKTKGIMASLSHSGGRDTTVLGMALVDNHDVVTLHHNGRKLLEISANDLGAATCLLPLSEPE